MINLQDICSLPIEFDDFENRFQWSDRIRFSDRRKINLSSMTPTLLNRNISYPEEVYQEFSVCLEEDQNFFKDKLTYDLMLFPTGLLGIEYIKSHIYYSRKSHGMNRIKFSTVVECIKGNVTVIMQRNSSSVYCQDDNPCVSEGITIELNPKDKIGIPEGYLYSFINTGDTAALISRVYQKHNQIDYSQIKNGLAYICIRKNAKCEWVYNPKFRDIPSIKALRPEENHLPNLNLNLDYSLYNLVKESTEIFKEILSE